MCSFSLSYIIKGLKNNNYEVKYIRKLTHKQKNRQKRRNKLNKLRESNKQEYEKYFKKLERRNEVRYKIRRAPFNFINFIENTYWNLKQSNKNYYNSNIDDVYK